MAGVVNVLAYRIFFVGDLECQSCGRSSFQRLHEEARVCAAFNSIGEKLLPYVRCFWAMIPLASSASDLLRSWIWPRHV